MGGGEKPLNPQHKALLIPAQQIRIVTDYSLYTYYFALCKTSEWSVPDEPAAAQIHWGRAP